MNYEFKFSIIVILQNHYNYLMNHP